MKGVNKYTLRSLIDSQENQTNVDGKWVPARPLGYQGFWHRFKMAWLVFSGKCDAVEWPEGQ